MVQTETFPTLYIPHGGGPCFFIRPEDMPPGMPRDVWRPMETYLRSIDATIGRRPKAVVVVSAHWMTPNVTIGHAARHELMYDYYNFPAYTYRLSYPAAGEPEVAARAAQLLGNAGIAADSDDRRGIDHGVFIPFMLIYPDADVPIVPMSLRRDLDAAAHLEIGAALAPLRDEGVLIVGSGMSFHNMQSLRTGGDNAQSAQFDEWLGEAATAPASRRLAMLADWDRAPAARIAHPEEEHLLPLMVVAGAGGADAGSRTFSGRLGGKQISGFAFGQSASKQSASEQGEYRYGE